MPLSSTVLPLNASHMTRLRTGIYLPAHLVFVSQDGAQLYESYTRFHFCFIPLCKVAAVCSSYGLCRTGCIAVRPEMSRQQGLRVAAIGCSTYLP